MREVRIEYKPDIAIITVEDGPSMRTVRLTKEEMLEMANETLQKYSNHWTASVNSGIYYGDPDRVDTKKMDRELNRMVGEELTSRLLSRLGGKYQVVDKNGVVVQGKIGIKLKTAKMYCDKLNQFGDNKPYSIVEK